MTTERKNRRKIAAISVASLALLAAVGGGVTYAVYNTQANNAIAATDTTTQTSSVQTVSEKSKVEEGLDTDRPSYDVDKLEVLNKSIENYAKKGNLAEEAKKALANDKVTKVTTESDFGALKFKVTVKDGTTQEQAQGIVDNLADWAKSNVKTEAWKSDPSNARVQVTALLPDGKAIATNGVFLSGNEEGK